MGSIRQIKSYGNFVRQDPASEDNILLLHHEGQPNDGTIFTDNSYLNRTMTASGGAVIDTTLSKFGAGSGKFVGGSSTLSTPWTPDFLFGAGEFTIETWIYVKAGNGNALLMSAMDFLNSRGWYFLIQTQTPSFYMGTSVTFRSMPFTTPLSYNTWYHLAVSRVGNVVRGYINGKRIVSITLNSGESIATPIITPATFNISFNNGTFAAFTGNLDEVRLTAGIGRYTGDDGTADWTNFPEITAPFPNV